MEVLRLSSYSESVPYGKGRLDRKLKSKIDLIQTRKTEVTVWLLGGKRLKVKGESVEQFHDNSDKKGRLEALQN